MSTQGGKGANSNTNSSSISGWFFNNQDKGKGGAFSSGNLNSNGGVGGGSNPSSYGNGFMSHSKDITDWQSGKHVNMWMPQTL